jgi:signal transduction histidine kinase
MSQRPLAYACERALLVLAVDAARSADTGGTGLRLAICRSITAARRGRLTLESQVGAGTTVRIRLLRCPARP